MVSRKKGNGLTRLCRFQPREALAGRHESAARTRLYRRCVPLCSKEGDIWKATARKPDDTEQVQCQRAASRVSTRVDGAAGLRPRHVWA